MSRFLADYGWLLWILIGLFAGLIARAIVPGRDPKGCVVTIVLGIGGAVLAGWLGQKYHYYEPGEGAGFLAAIAGAVVLLIVYRLIMGIANKGG